MVIGLMVSMERRENGSQLGSSFAAWSGGGGETTVCGCARRKGGPE